VCGLAGWFQLDGAPVDPAVLRAMGDVIRHRGPDEEGFFLSRPEAPAGWPAGVPLHCKGPGAGELGLAHRRLSIIDLKSGQQPLCNEDGSVWIAYNGEVYNFAALKAELEAKGHRFRTNSDTETIVHGYEEWGEGVAERLRGMFAFAIWDSCERQLYLARDRMGKKPLYYHGDGRRFLFGSEIKSILEVPGVPRDVDPVALSDYLSLLYVPAPRSIFSSIRKLPAAHYAVVTAERTVVRPYWDLPFEPVDGATQEEQEARLLEVLGEATDLRMISEVPLGAFLSGGVDSSGIVALMAGLSDQPVKTASISFSEKRYDESPHAQRVADLFGCDHHVMQVTPDAASVVEKLAWHYDEPFADSSAVPTYYVSKVARGKVTVALSGDGGDENFAGYRRYAIDRLEHRVRRMLPRALLALAGRLYPKADWLPQPLRAKTVLSNAARDPAAAYCFSMSHLHEADKRRLLAPGVLAALDGHETVELFRHHYAAARAPDHLSRLQYLDIKTYLCDDILVKVDRASMANSLEVRCPILDHVFMEYAATIPSGRKLKGSDGKHVLKKAFGRLLPEEILYRKKMGFRVPIREWLRGDLKDLARSLLLEGGGTEAYLQRAEVERLWDQHQGGLRDRATELWTLMMFNLWHRTFAGSPAPIASGA